MLIEKWLTTFGKYLILMGRSFSRPERMRMFLKQYIKEMSQLGVDSIGIVLLISFFIGAVICIQMKLNIQSPWMPRWVSGYTTREIMLLEFSSSNDYLGSIFRMNVLVYDNSRQEVVVTYSLSARSIR